MEIKKVGVVGCGLMGGGIAQTAAQAGYPTVVREINDELLSRGVANIKTSLSRLVNRGTIGQADADAAMGRLTPTTALADFKDCDIVIEAIIENIGEKRKLFAELDNICKAETIFASNTSSMTIIEIAAATKRPERVGGLHFFNPVPLMKLVEVVKTLVTSDETIATLREFGNSLGKTPILAPDTTGFVVNRLLVPYLLDAARVLEAGLASKEDIDQGMMLGCSFPIGPLALLDLIGIDTIYYVGLQMFDEFRETRFSPPSILKRMVLAGQFGRKSGKGFYEYRK
ncbi:MAG: 3-hydroxybutyryl-CoA dehydrogenase [Dehalococcoidia bacterium]|nr:3-hydroxybutyryl-CoA dehydrogenase [Dehalococcoidia bacterium]